MGDAHSRPAQTSASAADGANQDVGRCSLPEESVAQSCRDNLDDGCGRRRPHGSFQHE